jgi:small subunit ribosomal protein S8e
MVVAYRAILYVCI